MTPNRSFLFAPGNHPRKVEKVFTAGADAVILDLEDAVAVAEKPAARDAVAAAVAAAVGGRAYVRVNALTTEFSFGDLEAVVIPGLAGVILPKAESAGDIQTADWMISALEAKRGMPPGGVDLIPIIETAQGLAAARRICATRPRVRRVAFGAGDYAADLGLEWTRAETEMAPAQAEVVLASRLADIEPPIDTVYIHIRDHEGFEASARRGRQTGFQGKLCIHPDQAPAANAVFGPTADEIAFARQVDAAFAEAEAAGSASIQIDGYFIDYPIVARARRTLALADAIAAAEGGSKP